MIRRKTSERKAATQALQVIAESIRACRGRGGRPPASRPKLENLLKPCLQKSHSDIVKNIKISRDEGKGINQLVPMKTVITRRDSQISQESMESHSISKALINKENLKPSQNCETKPFSDLKSDPKVAPLITDADGSNHLKSVLKPQKMDIDLAETQQSMCPPEPVDQKDRKKMQGDHQRALNRQEIISKDQPSYSKTSKLLKGSREQLEMVLKLKKSQSLVDPIVNPEQMMTFHDNILSQDSALS